MSVSQRFPYKRATFATRLPTDFLYSPAHCWLAEVQGNGVGPERLWRVGYTKFALRMLGELVDVLWEAQPDNPLEPGQVLGSIEGFKAMSDIYAIGIGNFVRSNPELVQDLSVLNKDPYGDGWIYEFHGTPDPRTLSVQDYCELLDDTIDRILAKQRTEENQDA